jgi:hypothetical protein
MSHANPMGLTFGVGTASISHLYISASTIASIFNPPKRDSAAVFRVGAPVAYHIAYRKGVWRRRHRLLLCDFEDVGGIDL